MICYSQHLYCI